MMREEIFQKLKGMAEENYKAFNCKLIPGVNEDRTLGVRVPDMRKLAAQVSRGNWKTYLWQLEHCAQEPQGVGGTELFYEEVMLQGMVIAAAKMEADERLEYIRRFLPRIDNWAVCDTFCSSLKFADKKENRQLVWEFLVPLLQSKQTYYVRFAVVMMLGHYIDEQYVGAVLGAMEKVHHEDYYVKMAVAWNLSVCYVKFPEKTEILLTEERLDVFTHNKTIQKIRESLRVPREDKERLKALKRSDGEPKQS